ncbi:ABC-type transport auxiliary lipoprotein family protein [Pseudorhodobacter sp.]|uniref:ABC-type transport auxiliary lipoprotein family protein n=1 Tax=Pseudorhodobacter sp. TaxID=1934400 RepID=UPI0026482EEF|nr:ABC-type transport auxiliary lipoprotein family protein [Pseudorhodobacter sp.]MDN5786187.1 ABC-type transport auxiliary lipoprotein family protein [Pseudorhodobacter sp.]
MFRSALFALSLAALLPGCAALSALGGAATPLDAYDLQAPLNGPQARGRASARQLVVELPTAPGALNTDRILIRPNPLQAAYLPDVKWAEETPTMVQTLLVRSLEDSNAFRYVGRRPLGASGDYAIVTDLTDFQAEAAPDGKSANIRLRLTARLVREDDAAILSSRSFIATAAVGSTQTLDLVAGFNLANQTLMTDVTAWVLQSLNIPTKR